MQAFDTITAVKFARYAKRKTAAIPRDHIAFGTPARARTGGLGLRSMAYHVIHGSDVTSNIIPYAE